MDKIVQIRIGEYRDVFLCNIRNMELKRGDCVILNIDRGLEYGTVFLEPSEAPECKIQNLPGNVMRIANTEDLARIERNKDKAREAITTCVKKINEQKLDMKVVHGEYSFDNSKVVFFFISDERVDFRNLVRELAGIFHARIELKQIGVRDKAKTVGGIGPCGRHLCCSSYMREFHPLTIKMAKEQDLPINPSRISGVCGRIKCCMAYEFPLYRQYVKTMPKKGAKISTPQGKGKVIDINFLTQTVRVDLGEGKIIKMKVGKEEDGEE